MELAPLHLDLTCLVTLSFPSAECRSHRGYLPKSALKAGSTFPPLARSTALTTAASIEGNASFSVFSACCSGDNGRGGFGGATSSPDTGRGAWEEGVAFGDAGVSVGSSSKSNAFAVVGDSGGASGFCGSQQVFVQRYRTQAAYYFLGI